MEYTGKDGEKRARSPKVLRHSPEGHQKPHKRPHPGWSILADGSVLDRSKSPQKLDPTALFVDLGPLSRGSSFVVEASEPSKSCEKGLLSDKLRCWFDHFHGVLLKEICARETLRPIPPVLGEGQSADLFKLFLAVREKGGCNAVSKNGLWGSVAEESGLGLKFAAAVKLVYIKYLDTFERWLDRIVVGSTDPELCFGSVGSDVGQFLMELQAEFKGFLPEISSDRKVANDGSFPRLDLSYNLFFDDAGEVKSEKLVVGDVKNCEVVVESDDHVDDDDDDDDKDDIMILDPATIDEGKFSGSRKRKKCEENDVKLEEDGEKKSLVVDLDGGKSSDNSSDEEVMNVDSGAVRESNGDDDLAMNVDSGAFKEAKDEGEGEDGDEESRESLRGLMNWVRTIAKDPGDPVFGSLPESSKWRSYGNVETWKQVLLAREAIFLRRNIDSGSEQPNWQKTQRMHPSMYGDQLGSCYNLRERLKCRKKLLTGKSASEGQAPSDSSSATSDVDRSPSEDQIDKLGTGDLSMENSFIDRYSPSRIPTGPAFQAQVPAWTGETFESDSKWLGSRAWPLEQSEERFLVERDPIGRGRQDSCGCQVPGSTECVRFHIAEKKLRVKRELGSAFYLWRFHKMGEEVTMFWTEGEEKKFKNIVISNPPSLEKCFWDEIYKVFPTKRKADLVSYYYNVFLLRRRAHQNRFSPSNIDSDDEESEPGLVTKGFGHETPELKKSILLTPNKQHRK
ncbi:ARID DNA-binding domain containing protein [Trema orientale]|uniref:ARID DNA-binding domain containing protein n=1 Tax=Trema orientale TaxID=63057 RepID=A0A2P5F2U7_TREOI|nr:ARID DNA-binding domain containing protein [Trema orientale]